MQLRAHTLAALFTCACVAACSTDVKPTTKEGKKADMTKAHPTEPAKPKAEAVEPDGSTDSPAAHMAEHFAKAEDMKAAIIAGKVDGLREPGRWLADHPATTEIPDAWKPHLDGFREVTQAAASAEDIDAAAGSFVAVGNACAACHSAVGGPKFELGEPPGEQSGTAGHMARHQWAADRLWEGLITPSEELWIAGAEALADAPLHPTQLAENQTVPPEIEKLAKQVHEIGAKARDVKSSGIQGMYYGQLLATCAACHQQLDAKQ